MHPPFYIPDHPVGHDHTLVRRTTPQRLDLRPCRTDWPPMPLVQDPAPPVRPRLVVVPTPRPTLRDALGRFLIRLGQRMILNNRPG